MHPELRHCFARDLLRVIGNPDIKPNPLLELAEKGLEWKPAQRRLLPVEAISIVELAILIELSYEATPQGLTREQLTTITDMAIKIWD